MPKVFPDPLFAFRRRTGRAAGQRRSRSSRAGAVAALNSALVLFCPGVAPAAPGDLDPTVGTGGKVTTHFTGDIGAAAGADAVAVQSDGKIITVGLHRPSPHNSDFAVARPAEGFLIAAVGLAGKVLGPLGWI